MAFRTLKQRLQAGERCIVFAAGRLFHPNMVEVYALHGGFHGFWIDHEHTGFTVREMETAATAGRAAGLDCFVRIAPTDYALVTRCLESGASGVMAAQINSAAMAEEFVQWCKFAPQGRRGLNSGGYDGRFGTLPLAEFCRQANEQTLVIVQIETAESVECVDEIAAVEGVDLLFVGPADLSQALGRTGEFLHSDCVAAVDRVAAACEKHGKSLGAVTLNPDHAAMLLERGCRLISPTNDVRTFNVGIEETKRRFGALFSS